MLRRNRRNTLLYVQTRTESDGEHIKKVKRRKFKSKSTLRLWGTRQKPDLFPFDSCAEVLSNERAARIQMFLTESRDGAPLSPVVSVRISAQVTLP
jgi:hypothetical protein